VNRPDQALDQFADRVPVAVRLAGSRHDRDVEAAPGAGFSLTPGDSGDSGDREGTQSGMVVRKLDLWQGDKPRRLSLS